MDYSFKRGFRPDLNRIKDVLDEEFPYAVREEDDKLVASYRALKKIVIWIEGKKLFVVTESNPEADEEEILDTNKRFRNFLEKATGYTAKQRMKQAKKGVTKN
ncbi:MAG: DUF5611 family protein [Methanotrichaceae archaeon]